MFVFVLFLCLFVDWFIYHSEGKKRTSTYHPYCFSFLFVEFLIFFSSSLFNLDLRTHWSLKTKKKQQNQLEIFLSFLFFFLSIDVKRYRLLLDFVCCCCCCVLCWCLYFLCTDRLVHFFQHINKPSNPFEWLKSKRFLFSSRKKKSLFFLSVADGFACSFIEIESKKIDKCVNDDDEQFGRWHADNWRRIEEKRNADYRQRCFAFEKIDDRWRNRFYLMKMKKKNLFDFLRLFNRNRWKYLQNRFCPFSNSWYEN